MWQQLRRGVFQWRLWVPWLVLASGLWLWAVNVDNRLHLQALRAEVAETRRQMRAEQERADELQGRLDQAHRGLSAEQERADQLCRLLRKVGESCAAPG